MAPVLGLNEVTPPSLSRWLAGFCTTAVMISSETQRSAKAQIHRDKLGGVNGHRLIEDSA